MMDQTPDHTKHQSSKSDEEAINWLIRLTEMAANPEGATAACQQIQDEFNRWATQSSANLRSFLEVASIFEALGECEAELVHELVAQVDRCGNIVSLGPPENRIAKPWRPMVGIAAMLVLAAIGVLFWRGAGGTAYRTESGELRRIPLEDGSVALLGEQSELRVSYSKTNRTISFRRGHAVFDVAKDPRRPFLVVTTNARIQALGTRIDVVYRNGPTRVTVVDGSVRVSTALDALQPNHTRILIKEEGVEVSGRTIIKLDRSQVKNALASQREVVVFDQEQLATAARRINFDNRRQLRFADPAAGQRPINGRYMTDDPEGLVRAIQSIYPDLEVQETNDGWLVTQRATEGHAK